MKKSLFLKILTGHLIVMVILTGVFLFVAFDTIKSSFIDRSADNLTSLARALLVQAAPLVQDKEFAKLDRFAKTMSKEVSARITVVLAEGRVVADSEENPQAMENHRTRTEIAQALEGHQGRFIRYSDTVKQDMLYIAVPVESRGTTIGALRVSLYLKDMNRTIRSLWLHVVRVSALVAVIGILLSLWLTRNLSRPIGELRTAAKKVAARDFSARVFFRSNDELKDLADTFNDMVREISLLVSELSHQTGELNTILSSLQEGLLVLDSKEKALLASDSFRKISRLPTVTGSYYWEFMREPGFTELVKRVRSTRQNASEEVKVEDRIFLCNATFLESREEIAIIFHDITEMRSLERMKTDFVLNVSHELRTPLTSIKGFVETLEAEISDESHSRYLEIVRRNTDRVINIISDLLSLSELEEKSVRLETIPLDLRLLVDDVTKLFQQRITEKGLNLEVSIGAGSESITADPYKVEQILVNLLDNAIKYTEKGKVGIATEKLDRKLRIVVYDTGPGIPKEHLSRIFERFYVVDKSRSKRLGGTGLGLSIVKHLVVLHGGDIEVDTEPGKGTRFVVTLPVMDRRS